jgi:hypothetical protein
MRSSRTKPSSAPRRPALLAQWARAPIPADVSHPSDPRRERLVGVVEAAMRRPLPLRVAWQLRLRRFGVGAAVACLTLLVVGTGLARTGVRGVVARLSSLTRPAPEVVRVSSGDRAPATPAAAVAAAAPAPSSPPLASCPIVFTSAPARAAVPPAPMRSPEKAPSSVVGAGSPAPPADIATPAPVETELAAQNELYARAMMARRTGNATEAARALDAFVRLYPQAPLAQDARVEHFRALAGLHDTAGAARAAREYLTLYPNGFARDEARAIASLAP